jgi:hypothetical protein
MKFVAPAVTERKALLAIADALIARRRQYRLLSHMVSHLRLHISATDLLRPGLGFAREPFRRQAFAIIVERFLFQGLPFQRRGILLHSSENSFGASGVCHSFGRRSLHGFSFSIFPRVAEFKGSQQCTLQPTI